MSNVKTVLTYAVYRIVSKLRYTKYTFVIGRWIFMDFLSSNQKHAFLALRHIGKYRCLFMFILVMDYKKK